MKCSYLKVFLISELNEFTKNRKWFFMEFTTFKSRIPFMAKGSKQPIAC
jgi:hypothetical protein